MNEKDQLNHKVQSQIIEVQSQEGSTGKENKSGKKKKGLKSDIKSKEVEEIDNSFNIYARGKVPFAVMHRSATRPKKESGNLTQEEEDKHICPCCGLTEEIPGKVDYFKTCDHPDDFSNCGLGVVLYYDYIKFVIIISVIATVGITFFNLYYSNLYYREMTKICNNYYHEVYKDLPDKETRIHECDFYMTDAERGEDDLKQVDTFFFQFSTVNVRDYRELFKKINPALGNAFESNIINLSLANFIVLFVLFVYNLIYIFFLFNKGNTADYLIFTVSDYAIFLTNLYDLYKKFLANLEEVEKKEKTLQPGAALTNRFYIDKLGYKPDDNMIEIKKFEMFLREKIFKLRNGERLIKDFGVNRIDLCYKSGEIINLQKKLNEINEKINKIEFDPTIKEENDKKKLEGAERNYYSYILPICPFTLCPKKESLKDIMKEKEETEKKINELIGDSKVNLTKYFGGGAFVTFNTIKEQEVYMKRLPSNFFTYTIEFIKNIFYTICSCCSSKNSMSYYINNITFEAAPEPEDIIFENVEIKYAARIARTAIVYFISVLLCGISFAAIYGLNLLQMYVDKNQDNYTTHIILLYVISFAITGVTSGMDVFLEIVLEILTKFEKQTTWTNYYLSYSLKLTLFSFLNSAILPTFCEFFATKSDGYEILISNMLMKFLVNAFVTPAMWTLNFGFFIKKIRIYFIEKGEKEGKEIDMSQKELNELYEYPSMNVSAKYSYIAKTILMAFFYIPIFPLGVPISLLGFLLGYWLEKYNFSNMYKIPEMLNRQIVEFYTNYFVLTFFVYGIGDYVFLHDVYEKQTWSLVNIIFYGILIIMPYHKMLTFDYLHFEESSIYEKDYNTAYTEFPLDYERANPMTSKEGRLRFLEAKRAKGEIGDEEFTSVKNQIQSQKTFSSYTYQAQFQGPSQYGNRNNYGGFGRRRKKRGYVSVEGGDFGQGNFQPQGNFVPNQGYNTNSNMQEGGYAPNMNPNMNFAPPHFNEGYSSQRQFEAKPPGAQGYTSNMGGAPHGNFPQGGFPQGPVPHGGYSSANANPNY